ncbi:MAG TPA: DoxX family protein [Bauldia sp.]|nr:DoxX family protein [Bauldia sp.]
MTPALIVLGRFLLGANFAYWGISNVRNIGNLDPMIAGKGVPQPWYALRLALAVEVIGGVLLALSIWPALAALSLIAFTIVVTPFFHAPWTVTGDQRKAEIGNVVTNGCVVGGLLLAVATG